VTNLTLTILVKAPAASVGKRLQKMNEGGFSRL